MSLATQDAAPTAHADPLQATDIAPPPAALNFTTYLFERNAPRAAKTAYLDDDSQLSYAQLEENARRFAAALHALGLRAEERALLVMHDTVDWPVAFLGFHYAGVVPVAVNTLLTATDYAYMHEHSQSRAVLVCAPLLGALSKAIADRRNSVSAVVVSSAAGTEDGKALGDKLHRFPDLLKAAPAGTQDDDIAFWLYSSGSTSRPKGTVHTHGNLYWTGVTYADKVLGLHEDDDVFSAAKLFFAYGLGNALTFPLMAGATTVLMPERPTPQSVFQRLTQRKPTVFYGVPTLYACSLASPDLPPREQVALRVCTSAG